MSEPLVPTEADLTPAVLDTAPPYFAVSPAKLVVMSFCTFGLYEAFWIYSQWSYIRDREKFTVPPILRTMLAPFFCYPLFRRIRRTAISQQLPVWPAAGALAAGWIILWLIRLCPNALALTCLFSVFFLVPIQRTVNEINRAVAPGYDSNSRFTGWNKIAVGIGGLTLVLGVLGIFFLLLR